MAGPFLARVFAGLDAGPFLARVFAGLDAGPRWREAAFETWWEILQERQAK
jgi:hypothetical protein